MIKFEKGKNVLAPIYVIPIQLRKFVEEKVQDGYVKIKLLSIEEKISGSSLHKVKRHNWIVKLVDAPNKKEFEIFNIDLENLCELESKN